jgi:hypothetical protein
MMNDNFLGPEFRFKKSELYGVRCVGLAAGHDRSIIRRR